MALHQIEVEALTGQLDLFLTHFWYTSVAIEWLRSETAPCIPALASWRRAIERIDCRRPHASQPGMPSEESEHFGLV